MKTWQQVFVGLGLVAALAVPTGIAVAATDHGGGGDWHDSSKMTDGRNGHGNMDMVGHHADMGGPMGGPMGGNAPAR